MSANNWQLWKMETRVDKNKWLFQTDYAFIDPDGIINEYRQTNPLGCFPITYLYDGKPGAEIAGQALSYLKQFEGWKRAKTRMTDEFLSKGWLCR